MTTVRAVFDRILDMCDPAYGVLTGLLRLCCAFAVCALVMLLYIGRFSVYTYELYLCALELMRAPASLILLAAVSTVCIEELCT